LAILRKGSNFTVCCLSWRYVNL